MSDRCKKNHIEADQLSILKFFWELSAAEVNRLKCENCKEDTYCVYVNKEYKKLCGNCCDKERDKKGPETSEKWLVMSFCIASLSFFKSDRLPQLISNSPLIVFYFSLSFHILLGGGFVVYFFVCTAIGTHFPFYFHQSV